MFELETELTFSPEEVMDPNLAERLSESDLKNLGAFVIAGYKADKDSRALWEKRMETALNLATQLQENKTFPWPNASNVKFPLVTIAALQWASRAYPLMIQGNNIVKCRVIGQDPDGRKRQRSDRVSSYMSFQVLEEDQAWEEETDRLLTQLPIVGCGFKKSYFDGGKGINISEFVPAKDLVTNYYATSIETVGRKTHIIPLPRNLIYERVKAGLFCDVLSSNWFNNFPSPSTNDPSQPKRDRRLGQYPTQPDEQTPYIGLEQHVRVDLDCDGYAEPYIITVELGSGDVLRMVANCSPEDVLRDSKEGILSVHEEQYFTKFPFIPNPDGGIYDLGLGVLLGPLNESVNSLINQLIDAGTLATTAGGFLGRGVKIRGGEYSFRPFGWQRVDSTGDDLKAGIYPFPIREPSQTLLSLLTLLVEYTNRISGSTDVMVGENPGQNTPKANMDTMVEQGMKINTAIFKRVWRAFKGEFQKLYALNKKYVSINGVPYGEETGFIKREDFLGPVNAIRPAADPNLSSDSQRMQQAAMLIQRSMFGGYDRDAVERNFLRAAKVENIDELYKGLKEIPPPPNPKVLLEELKQDKMGQRDQMKHRARLEEKMAQLMAGKEKNEADIRLIEAQIAEIVSGIGAAASAHAVEAFEADLAQSKQELERARAMDESFRGYIELLQKGSSQDGGPQGNKPGGVPGMGQAPGNPASQASAPGGGGRPQGEMGQPGPV